MLRPVLCAALAGILSFSTSHAQEFKGIDNLGAIGGGQNPAQNDAPPPPEDRANPATPAQPVQNDPLEGTYKGDNLTVVLARDPQQQGVYGGQITMGDNHFPLQAVVQPNGIVGRFKSGEDIFDFTLALQGNQLTLTTGGAEYRLTRVQAQQPANPLGQGRGPVNPLGQGNAPAPNPNNPQQNPPQPAPQPPTQAPRIQIQPGTYHLRDIQRSSTDNRNPQMSYTQDIDGTTDYRLRIEPADNKGQIRFGLTMLRITLSISANGQVMNFDTDRVTGTDVPALASVRLLTGKEFLFTLRPDGTFDMDNRVHAQIMEAIRAQDQMAAVNLQALFPDLRKTLSTLPPMNFIKLAPPAGAQPGQRWKGTFEGPVPTPANTMEVTGECVLQSADNNAGTVQFTGTWKLPAMQGMESQANYTITAVFPSGSSMPSAVQMESENSVLMAAMNSSQTGRSSRSLEISLGQ